MKFRGSSDAPHRRVDPPLAATGAPVSLTPPRVPSAAVQRASGVSGVRSARSRPFDWLPSAPAPSWPSACAYSSSSVTTTTTTTWLLPFSMHMGKFLLFHCNIKEYVVSVSVLELLVTVDSPVPWNCVLEPTSRPLERSRWVTRHNSFQTKHVNCSTPSHLIT